MLLVEWFSLNREKVYQSKLEYNIQLAIDQKFYKA